ncbi:hypothetical protein BH09PAT1_BH09PAT1_8100 [soil metagenome]
MRFRTITPFVIFPLVTYFLTYFGIPFTWFALLSVVGGFLFGGLAEYLLHRVAFHNRELPRKIKRLISNGHVLHHRNPQLTENLILPLTTVLPISLVLLGFFMVIFGTSYSFWFYTGVLSSYFLYEFIHFYSHHINLKIPILNYLKKYHLEHHFSSSSKHFMITNPLFDLLFGTFK